MSNRVILIIFFFGSLFFHFFFFLYPLLRHIGKNASHRIKSRACSFSLAGARATGDIRRKRPSKKIAKRSNDIAYCFHFPSFIFFLYFLLSFCRRLFEIFPVSSTCPLNQSLLFFSFSLNFFLFFFSFSLYRLSLFT